MSKTWKWILGIVFVLMIVGAMFAVGYFSHSHRPYPNMYPPVPFGNSEGRAAQRGNDWERAPMMGNGQCYPMMNSDQHYRMMGGRGFQAFGGGFFLLGGLVRLAFFGLLLYGAYWLGRRNARIALDPKPAARVDASAAPKAES